MFQPPFVEEIKTLLKNQQVEFDKSQIEHENDRSKRQLFESKCRNLDEEALKELYEIYKDSVRRSAHHDRPTYHCINNKPIINVIHPIEGPSESKIKEYFERDGFEVQNSGGVCMPRGFSLQIKDI